jgi:apoptosis-inducing factor 1
LGWGGLAQAGDVTSYYDVSLGRRRVEHHDHAVVSGQVAGDNMAGARKPYAHQSMFWSDLGPKIGYEAVGILDSRLTTVGVWADTTPAPAGTAVEGAAADAPAVAAPTATAAAATPDYARGAVFYLRNKKVVGVLMWNLFDRVPVARRILQEGKAYDDMAELVKLMRVHD